MSFAPNADAPLLACPDVLRMDGGRWTLRGSLCLDCGEHFFPAQSGCARCGSTRLEACDLGDRGTLWSWTLQGFLPKAPYNSGETADSFRPYGVGYVEMPSGLKVESRLTVADPERLRIGMPMALCLQAYRHDADGAPVHTYAFAPLELQS